MAKSSLPLPTSKGAGKKLLGAIVLLMLLVLMTKHPTDAAIWVKSAFGVVGDVVNGLVTFFRTVSN